MRLQNNLGQWVEDDEGLANLVSGYFQQLFSLGLNDFQVVVDVVSPMVNDDDNDMLLAPFTHEEFKVVIFGMNPDKAPCLDGFNPSFYQHCGDVVTACSSWLNSCTLPECVNSTNVVLLPKKDKPIGMGDLRPISLCNVLHRLIAQVLANRLKVLLPKIISIE